MIRYLDEFDFEDRKHVQHVVLEFFHSDLTRASVEICISDQA